MEFTLLARQLLDASTVHDVLVRIATAAGTVVPGAELVSITLHGSDGRLETPVATAPLAVTLDELQSELGEGPSIEANRANGLGLAESADLWTDDAFGGWGARAAHLGMRSVLSVGLFPRQDPPRMGTLNFYSAQAGALDGADRDMAVVLAAHAATAMSGTMATKAAELQIAQLKEALRSRDVIGQAKGVLMERRGIGEAEAFEVLRAASQSLNMKLTRVAATLTEHRADL
ncbi:MAG: GAF and ANTAR domain-containing protein [Pseudonocardia sp.]|nr:GAF and ANTAR domain-containing protein [Pseudonocardia sp.]